MILSQKPQFVGKRNRARLSDLCMKGKSSLRQKDVNNSGPYIVYGASGAVGTISSFQNSEPYVAVVKDGAGVGRASACDAETSVLGTMQALLPKENVDCRYLLHLVRSMRLGDGFSGSTIPHIYFRDYGKTIVPFPDIAVQRKIVEMLDGIESQQLIVNKQIEQLDFLVKSRFVEMFGDPVENPKNWDVRRLEELGKLKNGVNFKSVDNGFEIKCLSVGDFKNRYAIKDMNLISEISLNGEPSEDQLLKNGDVVFVRSNGNKTLVGRCIAVFPGAEKVTFSGFCIRFRSEFDELNLDYLLNCLKSESMKKAISGRGANIQNLSQALLSKLEIPIPSLPLQQEFAAFAAQVDKSRFIEMRGMLKALYAQLASGLI